MNPSQDSALPAATLDGAHHDPRFDRPVFVLSPPRSGSTLLFETLARARGVFTIGGESHQLIETVPGLGIAEHGFDSNRLLASEATPPVVAELRRRFSDALRDREGRRPGAGRVRMLEKTPKNALRIPFLAKVFPEARFVYLHRDPRQVLGSMIDAWVSGRFRTYAPLPGWHLPHWSLLLVPGWRSLVGRPLADVVAFQWEVATRVLLDDLEALPAERWTVARYDALASAPEAEVRRLCGWLGYDWDLPLDRGLPLSRYTVTRPDPDKWRRHASAIEPRLPALQPTIERAAALVERQLG